MRINKQSEENFMVTIRNEKAKKTTTNVSGIVYEIVSEMHNKRLFNAREREMKWNGLLADDTSQISQIICQIVVQCKE